MVQLIKQRLKTKQTVNLFLSCLKELCAAHPDNLATILKHTIFNELSNARNPNNMAMLGVMFQVGNQKIFLPSTSKYIFAAGQPRESRRSPGGGVPRTAASERLLPEGTENTAQRNCQVGIKFLGFFLNI